MSWKKLLAFLLVFLLAFGQLSSLANPADGAGADVVYGNGDFNARASKLMRDNWEESYFTGIVLRLGSDTMTIDGVEVEVAPPVMENGAIQLPLVEIAEAVGADVQIDEKSGDLTITSSAGVTTLNYSAEQNIPDASGFKKSVASMSEPLSRVILENGAYMERHPDGKAYTRSPHATVSDVESVLDLKATVSGDTILLTSPYQTKQIIVQTADGKELDSLYGASDYVTNGEGLHLLLYPTVSASRQAHERFREDAQVEFSVPNKILRINALPQESWGTKRISADLMKEELIDTGKTDEPIIVAVIDTGVDLDHEHLEGRLVEGKSFVEYMDEPEDDYGHGTHVSGTIVDCTTDNVKIMPLKVFDESGYAYDLEISMGIDYAVENGAKLMNMSFGGFDDVDAEPCLNEIAIMNALEQGVYTVTSAGNDGLNIEEFLVCPARYDDVITVSSTNEDDISDFANFGEAVDLSAPGDFIFSSYLDNDYAWMTGTSMACPHVAAAGAMLMLEDPDRSFEALQADLCGMTIDLGLQGKDILYGEGVIDFRMHFGLDKDSIPVTGMSLSSTYLSMTTSVLNNTALLFAYFDPFEATDKGFTVTSTNPEIAYYENNYVYAVGIGTTTITFTSALTGLSVSCEVNVEPSNNWIDYAADSYAGGTGTAEDPYLIATAEQLAKMLYDMYIGGDIYYVADPYTGELLSQTSFKLIDDIDLGGKEWTPMEYAEDLGGGWTSHSYTGANLDGNGHAIYNLTVSNPETMYGGFFMGTVYSTFENLAFIDASVTAGMFGAAVFSNTSNETTFINCYVDGATVGSGFVVDGGHCTFINCFSVADTKSGGFAQALTAPYIYNSYAAGAVKSAAGGGFALSLGYGWYEEGDGEIVNSFAANFAPSGSGFLGSRAGVAINTSYYSSENPKGIGADSSSDLLILTAADPGFFKDPVNYADATKWAEGYPWDFENVWAIDPEINEGLPYLQNLPVPPARTEAPTGTWIDYAAGSYAGGRGTADDPYLIETPEQLARMAKNYRYGGGSDTWFQLIADIDMGAHDWYPLGKGEDLNSQIFALNYAEESFSGNILGAGNTVSNIKVSGGDLMGFVSFLRYGTIDGLTLENVDISGENNVGGLVGANMYGTVANSTVTGAVSGVKTVGGVAGSNFWGGKIIGASADVTLNGNDVGGIAGANESGTIKRSHATAAYDESAGDRGALVALNGGLIEDSYAFDDGQKGFISRNICGKIMNAYYVGDGVYVLYQTERATYPGTYVTEEQLKDIATYEGWDFETVWGIDPDLNGGFPYLKFPVGGGTPLPTENWLSYAASAYAGGTGTAGDPYLIETPEQLAKMWGDHTPIDEYPVVTTYYKLAGDIDLGGKLWTSVGLLGYDVYYMNIYFDGNGHEIKNLTMKDQVGLFGALTPESTVIDLGVTGVSGSAVSALSFANDGLIKNVYITGELNGTQLSDWIGGFAYEHNGIIEECYADLQLTGLDGASIVAVNFGEVRNTYATGTVMGPYVTGIAELHAGLMENCYSSCEVIGTVVSAAPSVSGLLGRNAGTVLSSYFDQEIAFGGEYVMSYGKSTAEMKDIETYVGWNFEDVWGIDAGLNGGYPYLLSLVSEPVPVITSVETTTSIISGLSAYLRILVQGENLEGKDVKAYLLVDDELLYETAVVDGSARMYVPAAPAAGEYPVVVKCGDAQGFGTVTVLEYNDNIWSVTPGSDVDGVYIQFNAKITVGSVTMNGAPVPYHVDDATDRVRIDQELATGTYDFVLSKVKLYQLFPSYTFTYKASYIVE